MDSHKEEEFPNLTAKKKGFGAVLFRFLLVLLFPVFVFLSLSVLIGVIALFSGISSFTAPISVPSQCKIVSSSVDIRSSKVCELGLLNYNAKHVFYSSERRKFRCRYDYYWASIFKVEYKDDLSGQKQIALAEAPNEALPLECRPNFGSAYVTKEKFKVNESYDCWYTSGFSKVQIYQGNFFNCEAEGPSLLEMIRRYVILSTRIIRSWFTRSDQAKSWKWQTVIAMLAGISTPLITITLIRILHQLQKFLLPRLKQTCFIVAYFSFTGWLAIKYGQRVGLLDYDY